MKSILLRPGTVYGASTIALAAVRFIVYAIGARALGPGEFGKWNILNLLLLYGALSDLGVLNGLNRQIALFRGRGDTSGVERLADNASFFSLTWFGIAALAISFSGLLVSGRGLALALMLMGPLYFFYQLDRYYQVMLKSHLQFGSLAVNQFIQFAVLLALVLPLTGAYGLSGFVAVHLLSKAVACLVYGRTVPLNPSRADLVSVVRELLPIGFPIMLAGVLFSVLMSVDRMLIGALIDIETVGLYSIAILVTSAVRMVPNIVSTVFQPYITQEFGRSEHASDRFRSLAKRQIALSMVFTVSAVLAIAVSLPWLVRTFLPEYVPGVTSALIVLVGCCFLPLSDGFSNVLNAIDRQRLYASIMLVMISVNAALCALLIQLGMGLEGAALSTSITYAITGSLMLLIGIRETAKVREE